ncbi:BZ3500_MvSof-1268-A1-R1_Chr8-2g10278 [Microbotryum saponariae]|uniref:BZ3500_MvSof-1268-A1-R1_Chr8-2g10278 protein n=1 Tax=Microbotryum saponariae TaxID=289078 RepID=A0A2X0L5V2_9BASI|nr:BZ3500_MvSof-1268-A1-R1_Chr8-2g10278 [Microbotryum saponariae]SDA02081.1 BZ3501_MvSof-1269-A2-R1_Chr8-2g10028 [Microbotryum saponariae]
MSIPANFPAKSFQEVNQILTSPGMPWEMSTVEIKGVPTRIYKHAPPTMRSLWTICKAHGKKDYIIYENERYTYEDAHKLVEHYASYLYHQLGCRKGDRIAICARNLPDWVWVWWATQWIGAVTVAVNAWLPADSLHHCLTFTTPRVVFVDSERSPLIAPMTKSLEEVGGTRFVLSFRDPKASSFGFLNFSDEIKAHKTLAVPEVKTEADELATIYFTSGTTGLPKGVMTTSRQYIHNAINSMYGGARMLLRRGESLPTPSPDDVQKSTLLAVPLFHAMGNHSVIGLGTAIGAKIVLIRKWDAEEAASLILKEQLSSVSGIPFMATEVVAVLRKRGASHLLESVSVGGAPSSGGLPKDVGKIGAAPGQGYGATEVSSMATSVVGEDYLLRPKTAGLPCPVVDIKIMNPDTLKEVPVGEAGEVWISGPGRTNGYWRNEKATKKAFTEHGFYRTGDVGYLDQEGFLYISDRIKDMVVRGGENIATVTIEDELFKEEKVMDCAAFGVPDDRLGETVAAAVVVKAEYRSQVTEQQLIDFVAKKLPKHSVPAMIAFYDQLPRNGVGKTDKKILRTEVAKLHAERKKGKSKL